MPVKRRYEPIPIRFSRGGRLEPDLPVGEIGPADFDEKINFRTVLGAQELIEGWDYPEATPTWVGDGLADFNDGHPAEQLGFVRRPNGKSAIVGCGSGYIKYFDLDANAWVTIGSGYSTPFDAGFRRWRIEDIAGYAVFNNSRDLPCTWQVGDAEVRPMYELREAGYASVGDIVEYVDGVFMACDLLEVLDDAMSALMNSADPYRTIDESETDIVVRIGYNRLWSGIGDPRSIAATVPGSIASGTNDLVLAWPMASFEVGDSITVIGAGAAGGNLQTTITSIAGVSVTLEDDAGTTVAGQNVQKTRDLTSISGFDDLETDGSAILCQRRIKTQLISWKASGHVIQTYYTGDVDEPFAWDQMTRDPGPVPTFPHALVVVSDEYALYPAADQHFYKWGLGSQSAEQHPLFIGAEQSLFFDRVAGLGAYDVWSVQNVCTAEYLFVYRWNAYEEAYYGQNRALAFRYAAGDQSLAEVSNFDFTCAASVQKPLAAMTCDETQVWFLMGDGDGRVTRWGRSNSEVFTRTRYGEAFRGSLGGGLFAPGDEDNGTYVRRFSLLGASPEASAGVTATIYGARMSNTDPVELESKLLMNPRLPGSMGLHYRYPYFKYRLECETDLPLKVAGVLWRAGAAETQAVDRIS